MIKKLGVFGSVIISALFACNVVGAQEAKAAEQPKGDSVETELLKRLNDSFVTQEETKQAKAKKQKVKQDSVKKEKIKKEKPKQEKAKKGQQNKKAAAVKKSRKKKRIQKESKQNPLRDGGNKIPDEVRQMLREHGVDVDSDDVDVQLLRKDDGSTEIRVTAKKTAEVKRRDGDQNAERRVEKKIEIRRDDAVDDRGGMDSGEGRRQIRRSRSEQAGSEGKKQDVEVEVEMTEDQPGRQRVRLRRQEGHKEEVQRSEEVRIRRSRGQQDKLPERRQTDRVRDDVRPRNAEQQRRDRAGNPMQDVQNRLNRLERRIMELDRKLERILKSLDR